MRLSNRKSPLRRPQSVQLCNSSRDRREKEKKKKEYQTKLWVSVVLEALFTCTISDTTRIGVGITTGNVNMMSLSLSLCRSNRKKWCLNIGSECFKKTKKNKKTRNEASSQRRVFLGLKSSSRSSGKKKDIWKHICAEFIICGIRKMKQTATQSTSARLTSNGGHYFRHHLPSVCQVLIDTRWKVNGRWEQKCFNAALPHVACVEERSHKYMWKKENKYKKTKQRRMDKSIKM